MLLLSILIAFIGLPGLFIWLIIYLFVLHQEKGEKFVGWLAGFISWTGKKAQKVATAKSIQGRIDGFIADINNEVENLLPYRLRIKWIPLNLNKESFIEKDRVVVMLNYHRNKDENVSRATLIYMNKAVIPESRPHIDSRLGKAIDLMMTKKALYSFTEASSSFSYFVNSILRPETQEDVQLKEFCSIIDYIDERGLFTRILLRELLELGRRKAGVTETGKTVYESSNFVSFLNEIAQKERGQDVPLFFNGNDIRVAIALIARVETGMYGTKIYIEKVEEDIKKNVHIIYILAGGDENIKLARKVTDEAEIKFNKLIKIHDEEFKAKFSDGKISNCYYSILQNRNLTI